MSTSRYVEHAAIVSGSGASLLSRLLRSPQVTAYIRGAVWLHGDDFGHAVHAIHEAACAWDTTNNLRERNTAIRCERSVPDCATMNTEEASQQLGIGERRVQQLAQRGCITGHRVGGKWRLDTRAVTAYQQQQNG